MCPLRDCGPFADYDVPEIVDQRLLTDRRPVTHLKIPWKIDVRAGVNVDLSTDPRPEHPQDRTANAKEGARD
jgi:hypothetical protein